ncbi:hypothetical protein WDW89_23130 [Deltaproteobacteria bacterium TL4]
MSKEKATKFLEAHVQYELGQLQGDSLIRGIEEEVGAVYDWLKEVTLNDLSSPDKVMAFVKDRILSTSILPEIKELLRDLGKGVYDYFKENGTVVENILSRELYDQASEQSEAKKRVRRELIHEALNSKVYGRFLTDILYNNTKEFMLTGNPISKKLPGASKLLKFGQNFVKENLAGFEESAEKMIKEFIEKQIGVSIKQSEEFLNRGLDSDLMDIGKEEVWRQTSPLKLYRIMDTVGTDNLDESEEVVEAYWEEARKDPLLLDLITVCVNVYFTKNGERSLQAVIEDSGLSREEIIGEGKRFAIPAIEKAMESGFLKERITARLEKFYYSKSALDLLK